MTKYVVQVYKWKRWNKTIWTRQGKPVFIRAARKALKRARKRFPESIYRLREVQV